MRIPGLVRFLHFAAMTLVIPGGVLAQDGKGRPHFYESVEVICVGIDDHFSAGVPKLNQSVADAKAFATVLERQFGFGSPKFFLNKDATRRAILDALDDIDRRAKPPEVLILYFACHGISFEYADKGNPVPIRVGYLVTYDAQVDLKDTSRPALWADEALGMRALVDRIERLKCRHVLLIADTCCSGFLTKRGGLESREVVSLLSDPSRTILAATTQHESAREGVFTKQLVDILNQSAKDNEPLSATDVFQKLRYVVPQKAGIKMTPQMSHVGTGDGEFVFIPRSVSDTEIAKLEEAVADVKKGAKIDNAKLVAFRGVLERKQKLIGRQSSLVDVVLAMQAPDYRLGADAEVQARRWEGIRRGFQENAGLGDVWAMAGLHFCYARGLGVEKSPDDAYYWAKQCDQFTKPAGVGQFLLARSYELGIGVRKNEIAANKLYRESAMQGFPLGKWALAMFILQSKPNADELRQAKDLLETANAEGVTVAGHTLARFYFGLLPGAKKDINAGIKLLEQAAANDIPESHHALYELCSRDWPGFPPKDVRKAVEHLFRAADLGHGFSQQLVASQYYREEPFESFFDLPKDYKLAFRWASLASQHPDPESAGTAHLLLSFLNERGHGVEVNIEKLKHHLEEGVRLNHANSMYFLGARLLVGDAHYKQDCDRAFILAQASAARGNANGHYLLGHIYHKWKDPMTGKFGFRKPPEIEYSGWTHHILHNYFQASQKGFRHDDVTKFLATFSKWHKIEQDGRVELYRKAAPGYRLPSEVMGRLQEDYPATAKQILSPKTRTSP